MHKINNKRHAALLETRGSIEEANQTCTVRGGASTYKTLREQGGGDIQLLIVTLQIFRQVFNLKALNNPCEHKGTTRTYTTGILLLT